MISSLRSSIALVLALVLTLLTLGRARLNWTGGPGAQDGAEDPARPVAAREWDPTSRGDG